MPAGRGQQSSTELGQGLMSGHLLPASSLRCLAPLENTVRKAGSLQRANTPAQNPESSAGGAVDAQSCVPPKLFN